MFGGGGRGRMIGSDLVGCGDDSGEVVMLWSRCCVVIVGGDCVVVEATVTG